MSDTLQVCKRCVYDSSVKGISFDESGECIFCKIYDIMSQRHPLGEEGERLLHQRVEQIKKSGKGKKYDCVVGVSGGADSTYLLAMLKDLGLRLIAVHYDNGWNSEIASTNIHNVLEILDVPLHTIVEDWNEMKDIQRAFLFASTPDGDTPTDIGLKRALYKVADMHGIKTVATGYTFRNEGVCPVDWTYMEGKYIEDVHRRFGSIKMKHFNNLTLKHALYYVFLKRITMFHPLQYVSYYKSEAKKMLTQSYGWTDYGGHHHENIYTKFYQSYLLPKKFGIDKRKREYSAAILSGKMERGKALELLQEEYEYEPEVVAYTLKKLGLTEEQFKKIMAEPPKTFRDYNTYYSIIGKLKKPIRFLCERDIFPVAFYYKYIYAEEMQN